MLSPFITELRCFRCDASYAPDPWAYECPSCAAQPGLDPGILEVRYADEAYGALAAARTDAGTPGMARFGAVLPVSMVGPSLAPGGTPLVPAPRLAKALGLAALYLKDETRNPTRCLKDRATAVAMAGARAAGATTMYAASAGNAAISLAGFCANAGMPCHVYVPSYASAVRLDWLRRFGATVHVSTGDYDQAFDEAEADARGQGWFSRNCALNPYLVEGKKTVALEIGDQLGGVAPDVVVAPVGDGCTLGAAGKGFRELLHAGRLDRLPRLIGAQAAAVQPLVERTRGMRAPAESSSQASSILVRRPRNALRLERELEASGGTMVAVTDAAIAAAQRRLAEEGGLVCEFTSASTLAALLRLAESETLAGKTAVLVVTGGRTD
jgi:threonine synthase